MNQLAYLRNCRAVTFDVGGTLIEPFPSVGDVYARVGNRFGINSQPEVLTRRFLEAWKAKADFDYSHQAWSELVSASFQDFGVVSEECFRAIYNEFASPAAWRIFPDVLPTLEYLRASGVRLGIVSNWDERLGPLLERLKLSHYFEQIVVSHEVGYAKPKSQIFEAAAERLQIRVSEILHIGDGKREDYQGARSANFNALLLDRSQPKIDEATISSLAGCVIDVSSGSKT